MRIQPAKRRGTRLCRIEHGKKQYIRRPAVRRKKRFGSWLGRWSSLKASGAAQLVIVFKKKPLAHAENVAETGVEPVFLWNSAEGMVRSFTLVQVGFQRNFLKRSERNNCLHVSTGRMGDLGYRSGPASTGKGPAQSGAARLETTDTSLANCQRQNERCWIHLQIFKVLPKFDNGGLGSDQNIQTFQTGRRPGRRPLRRPLRFAKVKAFRILCFIFFSSKNFLSCFTRKRRCASRIWSAVA